MCLIVIEMIIAVQLNIAYVGVSPNSPKELHDYIATLPHNFPIPASNNIIDNTEEIGQKHGLYRNTSIFHKRISSDVFNSYAFQNYVLLADSFPALFKTMRQNPLVYLSDSIYSLSQIRSLDSSLITNKTIVLSPNDYNSLKTSISKASTDSSSDNTTITHFSPNQIKIKVSSSKQQLLTLLQSHYKGWEVTVDQMPSTIYLSNYLTMSVLIPEGIHEVEFHYKNKTIVAAGIVSYTTFFILLILFSFIWIKNKHNYWIVSIIWGVLILIAIYYFR